MKIELLNVIIEIQMHVVVTDNYANRKNDWTPFYTCHATVSGESSHENSEVGLILDGSKIDFTVRYCKAAASVTSTEYRILFAGNIYNILGVDHMNYKRHSIKFLCQRVER